MQTTSTSHLLTPTALSWPPQGLYRQNQAQAARIAALEEQNAAQQAQIDVLAALEQQVDTASTPENPLPLLWPALGGLVVLGAMVYRQQRGEVGDEGHEAAGE